MGALAVVMGVTACGGGSDPSTVLSGKAAAGAPIAGGTVEVRCAGAATALRTVTTAAGAWQIDAEGQTLPCALRVTGGGLAEGEAYHSVAMAFDNTNITPLTDLMVANAVGMTPAAWWGSDGPSELAALAQSALDTALTALRAALGLDALRSVDPLTAAFTAAPKDKIYDVLAALRLALADSEMDYAALVAAAVSHGFVLPEGFRIALADNYATITAGGGVEVPGGGGSYTLTMNVNAGGVASPAIVVNNVPKPSSQAEFCGWVDDPSSSMSLSQQVAGGGAGTLTVNSCTFSGDVGKVNATMAITSPVAVNVSYSVTYTYR